MTWLLAMAAIAPEHVIKLLLAEFDSSARSLDEQYFDTVATAAGRIGISSLSRSLSAAIILSELEDLGARTGQLLCPFASSTEEMDSLMPLSDGRVIEMANGKPYTWPAFHAISARLMSRPSPDLLDGLRRVGHRSWTPHHSIESWKGWDRGFAKRILDDPADFPVGWVLAAEHASASSAPDSPLAAVTVSENWTPEVPRM
jgi:hypothetical protein